MVAIVEAIGAGLGLGAGTAAILLGCVAGLLVGTVLRGFALTRRADEGARKRWGSLLVWWGFLAVVVAVLSLGRPAVAAFMATVSLMALRESLGLTVAAGWYPGLAAAAAALYLWAWLTPGSLFMVVLPALLLVLVLVEGAWRLALRPRLTEARAVVVALLVAVVGPSFVVAVAGLPAPQTRPRESMGWLVLLLLLTELNDIAQAWWGRAVGVRRMAPELSPNKTWEGLLGGVGTTLVAAALLAPLITDYGRVSPVRALDGWPIWPWALLPGLLVATAGVAGDLTESWLKRRVGVKDAGDVLPGQGGLLDRIDSLAATAPVYFAATWLLWVAGR